MRRVAFLSFVAALCGILFGYDTAVVSGTTTAVAAALSADDELRAFERKIGVSGGDVWAGIPRHHAVVNPPVRAEGTKYISLAGEWELIQRPHGAVAGRSLQEIQYGIRWGGQRNKWYARSGTDTVHRVTVPGCWEASGIGEPGKGVPHLCTDSIEQELRYFYAGACWYRKDVAIPADWKGSRLWLKVGSIRSRGWCYVNGHAVALFDAGVGAWKWEITDFAKPGETALVMVCADNAVAARGGIATSKNRWGGIVRDIEIEATPSTFIDDAWVRGNFDAQCAEAHVTVGGAASPCQIRVTVEGKSVEHQLPYASTPSLPQSSTPSLTHSLTPTLSIPLVSFRPWSPAHPNLYTARVDLVAADGKVVHSRLERFGVRKLEVRGKDFYLNGKPFYIRGCGDNYVYPATGVSPADKDFHLAHLKTLKAAGFNYVRMHTHYEQPEYFDAADEAGVLLAPELAYYADEPNDHFDYDPLRDAYDAFVALRRNVSYAVRGVGNEGTLGPEAGRLIYRFHKELDPGSLAIEQDGGSYLRPDWGRGTSDFASGPLTSWRRGAIDPPVPLVAHEYLNIAAKADCRDEAKWSGVLAPPMTRSQRRAHLAKTGLSDDWLDLLQDAQHSLQKYWQKNGVEAARADPFCDGYIFWTIVDSTVFNTASGVYTAQGMFSPFWQPKRCGTTVEEAAVYNSPSCLLIDNDGPADRRGEPYDDGLVYCSFGVGVREATNRVYAAGEEIPLDIMLSHYDEDLEIDGGALAWRFVTPDGATLVAGEKPVGAQARGPMRILARERIRVPDVAKPVKATLHVALAGLSNSWDFWFFPKAGKPGDPDGVVIADYGSEEAEEARRMGKSLLVVGNQSDKANFTMGWWWLGKQVGTAVKHHPCLGDFPYEPFLSPLLFRVIKEGEALPVAGYAEEDYVIVGEGLKDAYLYLAAKERSDGGREVYVSGLDISGTTPESASLRANLLRWLTGACRRSCHVGAESCCGPASTSFAVSAAPVKTAVFTGIGPRGRGCVSWLQLVESSPELDLMLVDADMIRSGALDCAELLIIPGGASVVEKRDLGPEGAARIRDFVRRGGGYIGTCAGCCLALEEKDDADRGIGLIPHNRIGSKDGFMMPIALNEKGAAAMGMAPGEYTVSYHGGPVLVPSTNAVPDAKVEVWATYASDFDCPKSSLRMFGNIALVGGTYGKGRLFAIACHPESNVFSHGLVKGAFRFVTGREVTFPTRIRRPRSLVVGAFSSAIGGVETARALLDIDACEGVDFFPMTPDEILTGQLDRVDYLVLPAGHAPFYKKKFSGQTRELAEAFAAAGGKVLAWGNAAAFAPPGTRVFATAGECVDFIRREGAGQAQR